MARNCKICLQQSIIPDYRMGLFRLLRVQWDDAFQIYAGDADFGGTPVSDKDAWQHFKHVENYYILGGRFLWQWGCFRELLSADVTILNGNMRVLSSGFVQVLRKLSGRRTILWGHTKGQNGFAGAIRGLYLRFCDGFIAYTESQAEMVRQRYPWLTVWVAANSCVSAADCVPVEATLDGADSILYVGRLVEKKKVRLLLEGFIRAQQDSLLPEHIRLVFVGDGAERQHLEARAEEAGVTAKVDFAGHVSDVTELRGYYQNAICAVSPGYVGLSATQSFSFGVPMLIARDEFHSPEIEACIEGFNASFCPSDDAAALALALSYYNHEKDEWLKKRSCISEWTRAHYSFEVMRDTFISAVNEVSV
ncbi:MAG: glycosyltransferase [Opitutales bacterium]|nr:glycosyltransferase [Opitutales bacterium]